MKQRHGFRLFTRVALLFCLFLMVSCRIISPQRPAEEYRAPDPAPRYSSLNLPFEIGESRLKQLINREINGVVYADTSLSDNGDDGLVLVASKRDSITLTMKGNRVYYRVPLRIWVKKRFTAGLLGLSYTTVKEARGSIALRFQTVVSLGRDWTLNTVTTSEGYEWIETPRMQLGALDLPLPLISDLLVRSNMQAVTRGIDHSIRTAFSLRQQAEKVWNGIQSPVRLSEKPPLWLQMTPVSVSTLPLQARGQGFGHVISVKTLVHLSAAEPTAEKEKTALPPLNITGALPDDFNINLSADVPFRQISEQLSGVLPGMTFSSGRYRITVKDFAIYGQGEKLVIALHVSGSIRGVIYLTGTPQYNPQSRSLALGDLGFSIDTRNVLVSSASWVLRSGIIARLSAALVFPVGDQLDRIRTELNDALAGKRFLEHLRLQGTIDQLEAEGISISPQGVRAWFVMKGKISAHYE